jgi:hypothetical protein
MPLAMTFTVDHSFLQFHTPKLCVVCHSSTLDRNQKKIETAHTVDLLTARPTQPSTAQAGDKKRLPFSFLPY